MNKDTSSILYSDRLINLQDSYWKKKLFFLNPYRYHISSISKGKVLEIGCGVGRVLNFLPKRSVGVDHNDKSIQVCLEKGYIAYSSDDFLKNNIFQKETFDTIFFSHVLEHMTLDEAKEILNTYLVYLKKGGRIVLITPQLKGQKSDSTHVTYISHEKLFQIASCARVEKLKMYSFPFPKIFSKYFIYNENVFIGIKDDK